jgi:zinc transport system permease protein
MVGAEPYRRRGRLRDAGDLGHLSRKERATVFREGLLGALFLVGAAGTILLGAEITHEMHAIEAILHGVGVAVLPEDFEVVAVLGTFVFLIHLFFWRGFAAVGFDPVGARVHRLPVLMLDLMMALTLALAMASGIRALGALPVFALSILPSIAAIRLAPSLPWALVIGALLGGIAGFLGYLWSFLSDWPVGATQTLVALILAGATELGRVLIVAIRKVRGSHTHATSGGTDSSG